MLKKLVEDKAIGDLWELKWRNPASLGPLAHGSLHPGDTVISGAVSDAEKGSEWWHQAGAGGGALLDYCCYGACLSAWLIPEAPTSVLGVTANLKSRYGDAEDNAAMMVGFPVGAFDPRGELDHSSQRRRARARPLWNQRNHSR